ncbi:MAG: T9SS type A sorting domain-containing protein [Candidatus Lokiarchaeota archaeon]|nr:T9SS type A sorting domain-containing protein [Candidatus Lokiarchaeota archaeon]
MQTIDKNILKFIWTLFLFLWISCAFAGELRLLEHFSHFLNKNIKFYIYLPEDYGNYPVLFVLHGAGGDYDDWISNSNIISEAKSYNLALVFPDGDKYSWYLDSPIDSSKQYESYFINELIPFIKERFPTNVDISRLGLTGLSMGGHGAITLLLKYPEMFICASSMSGILDLTNHPAMAEPWKLCQLLGTSVGNIEAWRSNSAVHLVTDNVLQNKFIFTDCGLEDVYALEDNRKFEAICDSLNLCHIYKENSGGHNWTYWNKHITDHLMFHQSILSPKVYVNIPQMNDESPAVVRYFPNPFSETLDVEFTLFNEQNVTLGIYNILGQKIFTQTLGLLSRGSKRLQLRPLEWHIPPPAGTYLLILYVGENSYNAKITYQPR